MVFFSPEDLNIIKNGPAERRRFLDSELCQLDKIYLSDLTTYNKILNQRNKLLKDMVYRPDLKDTLPVWDMQLVETGRKIIRRRKQFVDELNEIVHDITIGFPVKKKICFCSMNQVLKIFFSRMNFPESKRGICGSV